MRTDVLQRYGATLVGIAIVAIIVVWFASEPPPAVVEREARARAEEMAAIEAANAEALQAREIVETPAEQTPTTVQRREQAVDPLTEVPPEAIRRLEVLVLLDGAPASGVTTQLIAAEGTPALAEAITDASGTAYLEASADTFRGIIRATTSDGAAVERPALYSAGDPAEREVICIGRGGVEGIVWDSQGAPAPGVALQLDVVPALGGLIWRAHTTTAADGSYRVHGVPEANVEAHAWSDGGLARRTIAAVVGRDQWIRADFGSAGQNILWSGSVVLLSGSQSRAIDILQLRRLANRECYVLRRSDDGTFSSALPPGEYATEVYCKGGVRMPLDEISVTTTSTRHVLSLSGLELWGHVSVVGADGLPGELPADEYLSVQVLALNGEHGDYSTIDNATSEYAIACLTEGRYALSVSSERYALLDADNSLITVVLTKDVDQLRLDLRLECLR